MKLDSVSDYPEAIRKIEKLYGKPNVESTLKTPLNESGYRGVHLTFNVDGINVEVQLTTDKAWNIKKQTDKAYEEWRNADISKLSEEDKIKMEKSYDDSFNLWQNYYNGLTPEERAIASSLESDLASQSSPQYPSQGIQDPSLNSKIDAPNQNNNSLASVNKNLGFDDIQTPPVDINIIPQNGENNNDTAMVTDQKEIPTEKSDLILRNEANRLSI